MIRTITHFFKLPLAQEKAATDLEEAERQLLTHEAQALYHKKMTEYYRETYYRLSSYLEQT